MSTSRLVVVLCVTLTLQGLGTTSGRAQGPDDELSCESCLVIDSAGRVLWSRSPDVPLPNASTTKMVTAMVVAREGGLDDPVMVSAPAASIGAGGLDLKAGDVLTVRSLLYALLLTSSNEAAVALAEHVSGSEAAFVERMNRLADRIGAQGTEFVNAHGLDAPGHASTATDLARIGLALLEDPELAPIVATPVATIEGPKGSIELENRNVLLETFEGAIGIKTGQTLGAGNVLVAAAEREETLLVAVTMRSFDAAADAATLLEYGFAKVERIDRIERRVFYRAGDVVGSLLYEPAGSVTLLAAEDVDARLARSAPDAHFVITADPVGDIGANEEVGRVEARLDGRTLTTVGVVAGSEVEVGEPSWFVDAVGGVLSLASSALPGGSE